MERKPEDELMDLDAEVDAYIRGDFAAVNQAFAERLAQLSGSQPDTARALDLGTGPADIPIRIARLKKSWTILAVDGSAPMLDAAATAVRAAGMEERIELLLADAKDTQFPAGSFDVIFSNSILHHVSEPLPFWSEIRRLCTPGGLIFVRDLARPNTEQQARQLVDEHALSESELLREEFFRSMKSAYTPAEVKAQLRDAGFKIAKASFSDATPPDGALAVVMSSDRHLDVFGLAGAQ